MYRRPKFLEVLLEIRREMALEADFDVDLFVELARSGNRPGVDLRPSTENSNELEINTHNGLKRRRRRSMVEK